MCTFKCNIEYLLKSTFYLTVLCILLHEQVHHHVHPQVQVSCNLKCALSFNLKCWCASRSTITSTLNSTGMFILKCKHHQIKCQVHTLCQLIMHFQLLSKKTLRRPSKSYIKFTIKCIF